MIPSIARHPAGARTVKVTQPRVVLSEWTKLRSVRSSVGVLAAGQVFVLAIGIIGAAGTVKQWPRLSAADRAGFDPTVTSLNGVYLAQLAIGVLGVLAITGEYSTGMIRSSLAAVPRRLPVLWAKGLVFALTTLLSSLLAVMVTFFVAQAVLAGDHLQTSLDRPGVARAVVGEALYLTVVSLLGLGLGGVLRNTAAGIAALVAVLLVVPLLGHALPRAWIAYLPSNAGAAILSPAPQPGFLSPWTGLAVFCGYAVLALAAAAIVLVRRDA
jgi:ABC-2 type transport system permease protein